MALSMGRYRFRMLPQLVLCAFLCFLSVSTLHGCGGGGKKATMAIRVTQTAYVDGKSPELLAQKTSLMMYRSDPPKEQYIQIDRTKRFQQMLGFGGAFTEAAAINWKKLSKEDQDKVIQLYFAGPEDGGHGYTVGRVPMGSCDFTQASYNFDNTSGDVNMKEFDTSVAHDESSGMLDMIRAAQAAVQKREGNQTLNVFASPWSPPPWMKNGIDGKPMTTMTGSSKPNGLNSSYQLAWAKYFSAFISAYKAHGVDLWGVTPQNEPEFAAPWEACAYTPDYEAQFVRDHLGPVLHADHPGVKIIGYDHNKDHVVTWAKALYSDKDTAKWFDGIGVHWYGGLNTENLDDTHNIAPDKFILATEACNCPHVVFKNQSTEWWSRAEKIAIDILEDIKWWSVGWVDWNLVLDTHGGPNHLNNQCDANIIVDPSKDVQGESLIMQASYYYMGHFSRFIPHGSHRIGVDSTVKTPPLTSADVLEKRLKFVTCRDIQGMTWSYNDVEGVGSLQQLGLCAELDEASLNQEAIVMRNCSGKKNQQWLLEHDESNSGKRFRSAYLTHKYITAKKAAGDSIGMDPGTDVEAGFAENSSSSEKQSFDLTDAGSQSFPKGFHIQASDGNCMLPVGADTITFDAVAFETPEGDISVVAMNLGEQDIVFDLYDVASQSGATKVNVPKHGITSFQFSAGKKVIV